MSKKIYVAMSPEGHAALQKDMQRKELERRIRQSQQNPRPETPNRKPEAQPQAKGIELDGLSVFLLVLIAAMAAWGILS